MSDEQEQAIDDGEFRVEIFKDASVHWRGHGKYTHLPTGKVEEFDVAWNDRSQQKAAWKKLRGALGQSKDRT